MAKQDKLPLEKIKEEYKSLVLKNNYQDHNQVFVDLETLEQAFKKQFKRNSKSQLAFSQTGMGKKSHYALTVWFGPGEESEVEFFKNNIK